MVPAVVWMDHLVVVHTGGSGDQEGAGVWLVSDCPSVQV